MINKIFKTIIILAIIIGILWGFSDSYTSHSIDNIVHVVAIGIDKSEDNNENMKVSFQFVNVSNGQSQGSSGGETSTVVTSINSNTLNKAINLMNSYIGKELNFSHCKVIVFSEDFAKEGISTEIYTLINNEELRPSTNIVISTSTANTYLKNANPNIEKLVTNYYDTFELTSNFTGYSDDISIGTFYNNLFTSSASNTAILGRTFEKSSNSDSSSQGSEQGSSEDKSNNSSSGQSTPGNNDQNDSGGTSLEISGQRGTQNVGIAVFKKDKYIGQLSELESICHLLVTNNVDSFMLSIPTDNYPDNLLDLNISPVRATNIKVDTSSSSPNISVSVYCEAKVLTVGENSNYSDSKVLKELSSHSEKYLKENIKNYLNKTTKELNADIASFSQYAIPNFLTLKKWDNYRWASQYANANFTVNVDLDITSSLLFSGGQ